MEKESTLPARLNRLRQALRGLEELLAVDLAPFDGAVLDGLRNGQIQKFEYCAELTWKLVKRFLAEAHAVETATPKQAIKAFFTAGFIDEAAYERLIGLLNDRNRLSHLYDEEVFEEVLATLPSHLREMQGVAQAIERDLAPS